MRAGRMGRRTRRSRWATAGLWKGGGRGGGGGGTNSAVGNYPIVASGLSSANYAISYSNGVLSVTNAPLVVSANSTNKAYGAQLNFAGTEFTAAGLGSTDYVTSASLASLGSGTNAGAGSYAITVTNAAGSAGLTNYLISYVAGTLTVGKAGLGVTANNASRAYGAANPAFTVGYGGVVEGGGAGGGGGGDEQRGGELSDRGVGAELGELCDQLQQRGAERDERAAGGERQQHEQGVWGAVEFCGDGVHGGGAGEHGLCDEREPGEFGVGDERGGGELCDHGDERGRVGGADELSDQLCGGDVDGGGGGAGGGGQQCEPGGWGGEPGVHGGLRRGCGRGGGGGGGGGGRTARWGTIRSWRRG